MKIDESCLIQVGRSKIYFLVSNGRMSHFYFSEVKTQRAWGNLVEESRKEGEGRYAD